MSVLQEHWGREIACYALYGTEYLVAEKITGGEQRGGHTALIGTFISWATRWRRDKILLMFHWGGDNLFGNQIGPID